VVVRATPGRLNVARPVAHLRPQRRNPHGNAGSRSIRARLKELGPLPRALSRTPSRGREFPGNSEFALYVVPLSAPPRIPLEQAISLARGTLAGQQAGQSFRALERPTKTPPTEILFPTRPRALIRLCAVYHKVRRAYPHAHRRPGGRSRVPLGVDGEPFQNPLEPPSAIPGQGRRSRESGCGVTRDLEPPEPPVD
jgi:hypothetical protein